jgi:AcrR family transcriptional regulator
MRAVADVPTRSRSDLREAILAVSERIGRELGQSALTMRNIASAIGVSPTILYQYFDSKAAILNELEGHAHEAFVSRLEASSTDERTPERRLRALCLAYLDFARTSPWLYSLLFRDSPGGAWPHAEVFARAAASCFAPRTDPRPDATIAGLHAWAAMHGLALALQGGWTVDGVDEPAFVEGHIRTVLRGLGVVECFRVSTE